MAAPPGNQAAVSRISGHRLPSKSHSLRRRRPSREYPCHTADLAAAKNHSAHPIVYSHSDVRLIGWPPAITRR